MICTKIPLKIIDIELHLIEIEHWLCIRRLYLTESLLQNVRLFKSQFIPTHNPLFCPLIIVFLSFFAPLCRLTFPPCSDIFVLNGEVFSFGEGICSPQLVP